MRRRGISRAVLRNAEAIEWVKTHTLQDLEDLVNEMANLGEDVGAMTLLLDDLNEIEHWVYEPPEIAPARAGEHAAIAG